MFGFQVAPELRKITEKGNELKKDAWRIGLNISYDIPIFTLGRSKNIK